jgi:hypothetical protein
VLTDMSAVQPAPFKVRRAINGIVIRAGEGERAGSQYEGSLLDPSYCKQ